MCAVCVFSHSLRAVMSSIMRWRSAETAGVFSSLMVVLLLLIEARRLETNIRNTTSAGNHRILATRQHRIAALPRERLSPPTLCGHPTRYAADGRRARRAVSSVADK